MEERKAEEQGSKRGKKGDRKDKGGRQGMGEGRGGEVRRGQWNLNTQNHQVL